MAVLTDQARLDGVAEFQREPDFGLATWSITKADLKAAFNALDVFLNDNAAAINAAIPQPARGALSSQQKAMLLRMVIRKRYEFA